jgi:hypothetical protein
MLLKPRGYFLVYFGMVLYEGKSVVEIIVTTLKYIDIILFEVWCISPVYSCYFMIFNVDLFLFLVWASVQCVPH